MTFDIRTHFRSGLPAPAAAPFAGFPRYNFVGGHNDAASLPVPALADAAARVIARDGRSLATYYGERNGPQGYLPLREFVAGALKASAGMADGPENVMITSGSLQALDLVFNLLLAQGDGMAVEEATYAGVLKRLSAIGADLTGVPLGADGMDIGRLRRCLEDRRSEGRPVKAVYTIPTVQNPTGSVMPEGHRLELLALAREFDFVIVEDDCYADLLFEDDRPKAIRALDAELVRVEGRPNRVIYCGSFSKSVAPAVRVGYIVADWPVLSQVLPMKTDAGTGALDQMILAEFCRERFASHVAELRATLNRKCDVMIDALQRCFGTAAEFVRPRGGIFIWVTLPDNVDTTRLAEAALGEGVAINPGGDWTLDGGANRNRLRLCFGHPESALIEEGVARLAAVCQREFGTPEHIGNTAIRD